MIIFITQTDTSFLYPPALYCRYSPFITKANNQFPPAVSRVPSNSAVSTQASTSLMPSPVTPLPQYASWDLAFHVVAIAMVDSDFAKDQLLLFLREWYMHPNGQIPGTHLLFFSFLDDGSLSAQR